MKIEILIIGSGPAGSSVAMACAKAGKKVAVVDTIFGGTCALRGCTPKRAMEAITSAYWDAKDYEKAGFPTLTKPVNWHLLQAHQSKFTALVPSKTKSNFKEAGIEVIEGEAVFLDPHTIAVGKKKITAEQIVIATGATPVLLDIDGSEYMITSKQLFELNHIPARITIVGGGYIGFEFAHILTACGAAVTLVSDQEEPLGQFDSELVNQLVQATLDKGVDVKLGYSAQAVAKTDNSYRVKTKRTDGEIFELEADLVINTAGRKPAIEKLDVAKIKLEINDKGGLAVDRFLQTTKYEHIHAIGDVTGEFPFTETASYDAEILRHNLLQDRRKSVDYTGVPYAIFTHPQVASVGKQADDIKVKYKTKEGSLDKAFLQRVHLNEFAHYKLFIDERTDEILGAHIIGIGASEMINVFAMAMQQKIAAKEIKNFLLVYPTFIQSTKSLV